MTQGSVTPEEAEAVSRMLGSAGWRVVETRFIRQEVEGLTQALDHTKDDHRYWQGRKAEALRWLSEIQRLAGLKSPVTAYPLGDVSPLEERSREASGPDTGPDASAQKETNAWNETEPLSRMAPPPRVTHPV